MSAAWCNDINIILYNYIYLPWIALLDYCNEKRVLRGIVVLHKESDPDILSAEKQG